MGKFLETEPPPAWHSAGGNHGVSVHARAIMLTRRPSIEFDRTKAVRFQWILI